VLILALKMDFRVCRICFAHGCIAELSSLFDGDAKRAEKFEEVTGINVS
jgi:hypothetical protein